MAFGTGFFVRIRSLYCRTTNSPLFRSLCIFSAFYVIVITWLRQFSRRDPGSVFFDPGTAYIPRYSAVRRQQAEDYIATVYSDAFEESESQKQQDATICIGVASVARDEGSYLRTTIGSLLESLTREERDSIHLIVFIPHTDPNVHPEYRQPWLSNLTDELISYNVSAQQLDHIKSLEGGGLERIREKGLFDYVSILKACYANGAPYLAILEDDIVAMDGWLHRTMTGLKEAQRKTATERAPHDFLYLRLFYTEEFFGWNSENLFDYILWSIAFITGVIALTLLIRSRSPTLKRYITPAIVIAICVVYAPLLVILFFAAGRVTTMPISMGINKMNNYGCCSQGLVFPRHKVETMIEWYEAARIGFVDSLTEEYADQHNELRWAITPSVIQHIGRKSTKGDDLGPASKHNMTVAEKLWSFAFENYDMIKLRKEHLLATQN